MRRWKVIGSVHSGDDKSNRSNRSRDDTPFQSFRHTLRNKSEHLSPQHDRSFCYDYLQKRKGQNQNLTYDHAKSQKNIRLSQGGKDDMFTSMRNILKDETIESKLTSKNTPEDKLPSNLPKSESYKLTLTKLHALKKDQSKLKRTLQTEFTSIKNMLYHIEQVVHISQGTTPIAQSAKGTANDPGILKDILQQAMSVERYFAEMDRKKAQIMNKLSNQ